MTASFNPPPSWPEPHTEDYHPPAGWTPGSGLPEPPAGWRLNFEEEGVGAHIQPPVERAAHIRASAIRNTRSATYPISVTNPGQLHAQADHPESEAAMWDELVRGKSRVRRRFGTLFLGIVGVILIVATMIGFWWLYTFAMHSLPSQPPAALSQAITVTETGLLQPPGLFT